MALGPLVGEPRFSGVFAEFHEKVGDLGKPQNDPQSPRRMEMTLDVYGARPGVGPHALS